MTKTTDESEIVFDRERIRAVVQGLIEVIESEAESGEEAYAMAVFVLARFALEIKPAYRESKLVEIGEVLRGFWARDEWGSDE